MQCAILSQLVECANVTVELSAQFTVCLFLAVGTGVLATSKQSSKIDKQACINVDAFNAGSYPGCVTSVNRIV